MESRLPKPKAFVLKNTLETTDVKSQSLKMNGKTDLLDKAASSLTVGLKTKSKSTLNINTKLANENKPPPKPLLTRSQTSSVIARNGATKAVKRLGGAINAIEAKRANVKPIVKAAPIRPGRVGAVGATTGKAVGAVAGGARPVPKPSKWDLKGRLELANSELASIKEKHKKCGEFESLVNELRSKENDKIEEIEKLESAKTTLMEELTMVKKEYEEIQQSHEEVKREVDETKTSLSKMTECFENSEKTRESQKKMINEYEIKVECMEKKLSDDKNVQNELHEKIKELQTLVHSMDRDRRVLHNTIQELKGNIRVFCRVRPRISREASKTLCSINFIDESTMEIGRADAADTSNKRGTRQEFSFDKIFPPNASQSEVFEELSMLVQSALEGYNVCVFAYGQTGSGKTYTMEGSPTEEAEGMIPRTVRHIFEEMKQFELLGWEYKIEASFLEIYNEHIVDLLDAQQKNHEIRMADSKGHDLYVTNLQVEEIHSPEELHECLRTAQQNRAVAATFANERSSRSHSVARIRLIGVHREKDEQSIGNLNLVDLAGSERLKTEEAVRTTETKNINKSLANLGNVILALLKKQDHIPYRNSKLTHLLMPSLGGNSKTLMLLNVSPLDECYNETLNSLRFASNVNSCKLGSVKRSRTIISNPL